MAADNGNTCGLTQEKLDNHPNWVTERGICIALKPDGTECRRPYSAHLSHHPPGIYFDFLKLILDDVSIIFEYL